MSAGKYSGALLERDRWVMYALLYIYVGMCVPVSYLSLCPCLKECMYVCIQSVWVLAFLESMYLLHVQVEDGCRPVLTMKKKMSVPSCWHANVLEESKCFTHSPGDWTVAILTGWANQLFLSLPRKTWAFASNQAGYTFQGRTLGYK